MTNRTIGFPLFALLASALFVVTLPGCAKLKTRLKSTAEPAEPARLPQPDLAKAAAGSVATADVAERVTKSVVSISAKKVIQTEAFRSPFSKDPFFRRFFGPWEDFPKEQRRQGLGSGVIVRSDGVVLTNHHVVANAEEIRVFTADKREFKAKVAGSDKKSDLAVLQLEGNIKGLLPLPLGDSSRLRLGDVVLAVGNPFGVGQTVTMGIVSAKGRANVGIVDYEDFIQTDAAINPGNSGGALVNMEGKLVGINTAILSRSGGYQGIGFAIPSNMAKPIMQSLLTGGRVVRGWLGIVIQDIDQKLAAALGLEEAKGVLVSDVKAGGPGQKGGLLRGDVIVSIDGRTTDSTGRLRNLVAAAGAGKKIEVLVRRDGKKKRLSIRLGEAPGAEGKQSLNSAATGEALAGLSVEPLTQANRSRFKIPPSVESGLVVLRADRQRYPLRPGDVIVEVNRRKASTPGDLRDAHAKAKGPVLLLVYRDGTTLFLTLPKK